MFGGLLGLSCCLVALRCTPVSVESLDPGTPNEDCRVLV